MEKTSDNPINLGWERLLDDSDESSNGGPVLCRVELTCSQLENPYSELSTQQTADFLAKCDDDGSFPDIDSHFEQILSQYDSGSTPSVQAHALPTTPPSLSSTSLAEPVPSTTSTRIYSSSKGNEAVKMAKARSIPVKTRDQTDWTVRVWSEARNLKVLEE